MIDAGLGRKAEAIREGERAKKLLPITKESINGSLVMHYLAVIYTWVGEKDLAFKQLEATARIPSPLTYGELQLDPWWDSLRKDPRFEKGRGAARAKTFDAVAIPALFSFSLKSITMR